jgi:mannose-6-phosphate isomerase-like protein (cupin superfamily)
MRMGYDKVNLRDVTDSAAEHGLGELQEARFPREAVGTETTGFALIRVKPGRRQPFAHRHGQAEEVHVVLSGSGTMKVDDERLAVGALDVVRVDPGSTRAFEAGDEGLEYLVFSPRHSGDAEMVEGFWD